MNKKLDEINELIAQKEFTEAKSLLTELLNENEQNLEATKLLGLCNINLELYKEAQVNFEDVIKHSPEDASSWFYLASCYDNLNDLQHACSAYLEVIKLRENYIDAYKSLCIIYIKQGQPQQAIELAQKALEKCEENDFTIYFVLGVANTATKNYKDAIHYLRLALEIRPEHLQIINNLGSIYIALGDYNEANSYFTKSIGINPQNSVAYYNLGTIAQVQNRHNEACPYFEKAYEIEPLENYLVALALSEFKSNQFEKALEHYKSLASMSPEKNIYKYNLANCYEAVGNYEYAIKILEELVTLNPKSVMMIQKLSNLYSKNGNQLRAKEVFEKIILMGSVTDEIYYEYALLCIDNNDSDTAEKIFKKVLELNPKFASAHKDLGVIYLCRKLFDYAEDEFKKAHELEPENPLFAFELANFYHATSQFEIADRYYVEIFEKFPQNTSNLINLSANKLALKDYKMALKFIDLAINSGSHDYFTFLLAANINFGLKNYEMATRHCIKAIELNQNPEIENLLAMIYFEQNEFEKANVIFNKLLEKNPQNTNLLFNSAKCYEKIGDTDNALKQLEKAVEIFDDFEEAHEMIRRLS